MEKTRKGEALKALGKAIAIITEKSWEHFTEVSIKSYRENAEDKLRIVIDFVDKS